MAIGPSIFPLPSAQARKDGSEFFGNDHDDSRHASWTTTWEGGYSSKWRRTFWATAGLGWVVWVLSVSSAADQKWMTSGSFGLGIKDVTKACDSPFANESACEAYDAFVATQTLATVMCSVAVAIYTIAFFRPFEAKIGSTKVLGLMGGVLMAFASFFQMLAFIFAAKRVQKNNEDLGESLFENGPTYDVGVTTFVFGSVQAILILLTFKATGDGPLLPILRRRAARKESRVPIHPS